MEKSNYRLEAPYRRTTLTTKKIMLYMIAALIPAGINGILRFGMRAAMIILLTTASAAATEIVFERYTKKPVGTGDFKTVLTAILMAYCLPSTVSWYVAVLAGILCALLMQISIHFFNRNVVSPVILTRLILMFAFRTQMSHYAYDGLTMATPLALLKKKETVDTLSMIIGDCGGTIGETSVILLCLGAVFLLLLGLIDFRVSGMYLFSFAAFLAVFGGEGLSSYYLTAQLAGGGFMLALWFIAPEFSTLPITKTGRWIYGILLGVLTGIFRVFGTSPEGLCYAVLIANLCVPLIEKVTVRRPFGVEKGQL